ncbi:MAG: hypothetical protein LHW44_07460 [Candidatus Cloacimonetes bacterium]|nr:hypothetical protein [Candidatus Cloacimonadota bacterium]
MDNNTGFLFANANHALICSGPLWEEMLLYNIREEDQDRLLASFTAISGKAISPTDIISQLSGGQKVILLACLALYSPAPRLHFVDLKHSLDADKYAHTLQILQDSGKQLHFEES